jgi:RNA polymerase sigma factor (sigma-70 family)
MAATDRELEYQVLRKFLKSIEEPKGRLSKNLSMAIQSELTERQRQMVHMYYIRQMRMQDIAEALGVSVSTVSRTIGRGRTRLKRCLKYGGQALLNAALEE